MRDPLHFDRVADDYDAVRPGYPDGIVDATLAVAGSVSDALELGCGSGQLTRSLAVRGLSVHALDLGPALLARARLTLAGYPRVTFELADLRRWSPNRHFDLVVSGTAFHWLPPDLGLRLAVDALHPGGALAILRHEHPLPVAGLHRRAQEVYRRVFPHGRSLDEEPPDEERIEAATQQFALESRLGPVAVHTERWTRTYTRDDYLRLLRTYSDQGNLPPERWRLLASGVATIIDDEFGGFVERPYLTVSWTAHRR